ncbi:unnamed protein product [Gemmata massiliana]|uniref:Uncharacterized protein n=2 Tax=Gemmata massiliana TaxID=1210884 RepID=A0A6P2CWC8_9BACT|nr:unnamed protein product [Gemmata massiliana]
MFYARVSRPLPKLEHEGKRILTKLSGEWCYGIKMDKYSLLLESTDPGFVRPRIVCDLKDDRGFKKGAVGYPPVVYVEGVLRGAINLNTQPWAADWLSMTPPTSMEDFFILIDDAILVMPPRELLP